MPQKNENGFSLIEVIVVMIVVAVMLLIMAPNILTWRPNMALKAAARDLYSDMQGARLIAVKSNRRTAISFDQTNNLYSVCNEWDSSATPPACVGKVRVVDFDGLGYGIGYGHGNATGPVGTTFDDEVTYNTAPAKDVIVFNSRGLGESAGYVYLDHEDNATVYAIGSQTSGVISLMRSQGGGTWK